LSPPHPMSSPRVTPQVGAHSEMAAAAASAVRAVRLPASWGQARRRFSLLSPLPPTAATSSGGRLVAACRLYSSAVVLLPDLTMRRRPAPRRSTTLLVAGGGGSRITRCAASSIASVNRSWSPVRQSCVMTHLRRTFCGGNDGILDDTLRHPITGGRITNVLDDGACTGLPGQGGLAPRSGQELEEAMPTSWVEPDDLWDYDARFGEDGDGDCDDESVDAAAGSPSSPAAADESEQSARRGER